MKTPLVYPPLASGSQQNEHSMSQGNTDTQTVEQDNYSANVSEADLFDEPSSQLHPDDSDMTSAHYQRRKKAASAWDDLLPLFMNSTLSMCCIPSSAVCVRCKVVAASVRCRQCGPTTLLCDMCTVEHHGDESFLGNVFHTPEKWMNVYHNYH